jgi:hypothetical protein
LKYIQNIDEDIPRNEKKEPAEISPPSQLLLEKKWVPQMHHTCLDEAFDPPSALVYPGWDRGG